jgi:hypothetical protein
VATHGRLPAAPRGTHAGGMLAGGHGRRAGERGRQGGPPAVGHVRRRRGGGRARRPTDGRMEEARRRREEGGCGMGRMGVGIRVEYIQDSWAGQVSGLGRPTFGWVAFVLCSC